MGKGSPTLSSLAQKEGWVALGEHWTETDLLLFRLGGRKELSVSRSKRRKGGGKETENSGNEASNNETKP